MFDEQGKFQSENNLILISKTTLALDVGHRNTTVYLQLSEVFFDENKLDCRRKL